MEIKLTEIGLSARPARLLIYGVSLAEMRSLRKGEVVDIKQDIAEKLVAAGAAVSDMKEVTDYGTDNPES